jgi:hypothetical protein
MIHQRALENTRFRSSSWHTDLIPFIKDDCGGQMISYCLSLSTTAGASKASLVSLLTVVPSFITKAFVAKRYQNLGLLTV